MSDVSTSQGPIYSTLSTDPDLGELVGMFVDEMPQRIESLKSAHASANPEELCRFAHQMKGASGSYGFGDLTDSAATLENLVRNAASETEIQTALQTLIDMCQRVTADSPPD